MDTTIGVKQKSVDEKTPQSQPGKSRGKKPKPKREGPRKLTFKENRELENMPSLIESLEQEHALLFGPHVGSVFLQE